MTDAREHKTVQCRSCGISLRVSALTRQGCRARVEEEGWKLDPQKKSWSCIRCNGSYISPSEFERLLNRIMEAK